MVAGELGGKDRNQATASKRPGNAAATADEPLSGTISPERRKELKRESHQKCTTQQWLRDGNGLVPQGLQAEEVANAAPFKLPRLMQQLEEALQMYKWRREWLTTGSRNKLGLVAESRIALLVDTTFDDPTAIISALEQASEEQLGDCTRVALMSFDERGIRREMDELDVVEVSDATDKQSRIDTIYQWVHRLRRGREKHRTRGLASNLARGAAGGLKRVGKTAVSTAKTATTVLSDLGKAMTGSGTEQTATVAPHFDKADIEHPSGPDLIAALQAAMNLRDIDGIYIVIGAHPMHSLDAIQPHLDRLFEQPSAALHMIDYSLNDQLCAHYLKDVVQKYDNVCDTAGVAVCNRYMAYSVDDDRQLPGSDDLELIEAEITHADQALRDVKARAEQAKEVEREELSVEPSPSPVVPKASAKKKKKRIDPHRPTRSQLLQQAKKTGGHAHLRDQAEQERLLELRKRDAGPRATDPLGDELTSQEWIARYGFEKGLTPYQEFRSVSYVCSMPGLYMGRKYKSMGTIEWDDGSVRNIHIDVAQIADYRKRLLDRIKMVNERVAWLGTGSRRIFGNLAGDVITLVIDTSAAVQPYWTLVQSHLQDLFQNHLPHKRWFNIVRYDKRAVCFEPHVVQVSEENLQKAWDWILEWDVGKHPFRDLMGAVELATDQLQPQHHGKHHIYLLCAGEPDFSKEEALSPTADPDARGDAKPMLQFVRRMLSDGTTIFNTIAYNCYQSPQSVLLLRRLAKESGGAFRLCVEDGTIHDDLHAEGVSWSTDTVQVLRNSTQDDRDSDCRDRSNHYYEVLEWVRLGKYTDQPGPQLDENRPKICLCDGDDGQLLRVELERASHFLSVVQNMLNQLPPEFAEIAETMLSDTPLGAGTSLHKSASITKPKKRASVRKEGTIPLDVLLKQTAMEESSLRRSRTDGTITREIGETRTSRLRETLTKKVATDTSQKSKRRTNGKNSTTREKSDVAGGARKGRYMVSNSTPTGKVQVTLKPEPEIGQGPARPLPKEKAIPATLPKKDIPMSSEKWLRKYGLKALRLDTKSFVRDNAAKLQTGREKKFGSDTTRRLGPGPWKKYINELKDASDRYQRRIRWLLSGTNVVFGCLVEKNVVLAVDTSGSMHPHMPFLREQLGDWLRSTVTTACHTFNVVQFNSRVTSFTGEYKCLIEATEDTCACAALWAAEFEAEGGTNVIGALEESTHNSGVDAVYLLSDGLPDHSPNEVLDEAERMSKERNFRVHTISFNADCEEARQFLQDLARRCGGRYHQFTSTSEMSEDAAAAVRAEDEDSSDDIRLLRLEVAKVESALTLAVAEELAAARSVEEMLSTRAPKAAPTPKWIPSSAKLEACDDGKTHNMWGKTSVGVAGKDARKIAETMSTMTSGALNDLPESERPSLFAESQRSWARASQVPRSEPEPTKSSLLLQNVTAQKVLELGGGPAKPSRERGATIPESAVPSTTLSSEVNIGDAIDTDDEDMLEYLPVAELYEKAGLDPPAPPSGPPTSTPSGRGDVMMSTTGLISAPIKPQSNTSEASSSQGAAAFQTRPKHRGLINGLSTQVTPAEVAEYISRWARLKIEPHDVHMPYDVAQKQYSGVAYVHFPSRQALLRATRMQAGQSNPAVLQAEALKSTRDNIMTPAGSAWLRRARRVEELLRGIRITTATAPGAAPTPTQRPPTARVGTATIGGDFFQTLPCGRTPIKTIAR